MAYRPSFYLEIGRKARGDVSLSLLLHFLFLHHLCLYCYFILFYFMFFSFLFFSWVLDLLYRDYTEQPPMHYHYGCCDWSYDLALRCNFPFNLYIYIYIPSSCNLIFSWNILRRIFEISSWKQWFLSQISERDNQIAFNSSRLGIS